MKIDIMALIVFFMMGFNLCIPVIQKQFEIDAINVKADPVGDPTIDNESWWIYPELQPGQVYTPPVFDWGKYWSAFKNHALWSLEGSLDGETWYEEIPNSGINLTTDVLNLRAEPTGDNSRKITLNFTAIDPPGPSTSAYYRFSFAIDYRVKNFVNRSGDHEYTLDFEVENETFSVAFNWSDYVNSPLANHSHVRHGITEIGGHDYFWFRVISDNPVEVGTYVELDPTYTAYTGTEVYLESHSGRKLVRQSNGTLWCTFTENNDLHVAWSEDEGVNWNDYEVYDGASYRSTMAVDSNDVVHLVFDSLKSDPDDYQLEYTNSSDWGTIVQIRDEDKNHQFSSIAIDSNDNLHVVYHKSEEGTSNDEQVGYISSMNNGGSWGTEKLLTDEANANDDAWNPVIAIDSNDVIHVVFQCEDHPAYDDIFHVQSSDYGDTWSNWEADPVYDDGSKNQRRPSIAIDDNDKLHVVWEGYSQNTNDQIGYSHNASSSWSAVEWVTWDAVVDHIRPSISVNDNDYVHTVFDVGTFRINHSVNDTSSWTTDIPLSGDYKVPNSIFAQHPTIDGAKTNRPKTGYAFVTTFSNTNVTYYASDDLTWDTGAVENNLPTLNGEIPANTTTGISLTPVCNVTVNDDDGGDTLDVCFYENTSGSYVLQQKNATVSPGTSVQWDSYIEAKTELTDYYWMVTVDDATDNVSAIYHFTTAANSTWQTLDTWNITLSNTTQSYILDTWNITLSNTTQSYILDTWNLTLSNTSQSCILDTWNITLSNTTEGMILDRWNITLSNLTISSFTIDTWNITLSNTTESYTLDTWNITLSNTTESYTLDTWNITLSNTTEGLILDRWNVTLSNTTESYTLDTWNITLSNTPSPYTLDTWNITLSNTTRPYILDRWNVTLSNTSFFNITDVKATPSEAVINNVTINITCNVTSTYAIVNVTLNMTEGTYDMANIGDLYYYAITNNTVGIHYYHIYANDTSGDHLESATYSFRIIGLSCSFTYTVHGGLMTLTPTITGGTHYQWTFINETGVKGITPWIPIGDIGSYIQGYVYPTVIRVLLSAKNINFNQYANYSDKVKINKSSFEKPEPTEKIEEEPDLKSKNIYDTYISDWIEERKPGEFLVIGSLILLVAVILFKKRPKKTVIYIIKKENIGRKVDKILEEKK